MDWKIVSKIEDRNSAQLIAEIRKKMFHLKRGLSAATMRSYPFAQFHMAKSSVNRGPVVNDRYQSDRLRATFRNGQ